MVADENVVNLTSTPGATPGLGYIVVDGRRYIINGYTKWAYALVGGKGEVPVPDELIARVGVGPAGYVSIATCADDDARHIGMILDELDRVRGLALGQTTSFYASRPHYERTRLAMQELARALEGVTQRARAVMDTLGPNGYSNDDADHKEDNQ